MRTNEKQTLANPFSLLAKTSYNQLKNIGKKVEMVGPEGLEPPTKRL